METRQEKTLDLLSKILDSQTVLSADLLAGLSLVDLQELEQKLDSWIDVISHEVHWRD